MAADLAGAMMDGWMDGWMDGLDARRCAIIDSSCTSGTSTLETYYSIFIARQLYAQKYLK